jgi:hypothetical protein
MGNRWNRSVRGVAAAGILVAGLSAVAVSPSVAGATSPKPAPPCTGLVGSASGIGPDGKPIVITNNGGFSFTFGTAPNGQPNNVTLRRYVASRCVAYDGGLLFGGRGPVVIQPPVTYAYNVSYWVTDTPANGWNLHLVIKYDTTTMETFNTALTNVTEQFQGVPAT